MIRYSKIKVQRGFLATLLDGIEMQAVFRESVARKCTWRDMTTYVHHDVCCTADGNKIREYRERNYIIHYTLNNFRCMPFSKVDWYGRGEVDGRRRFHGGLTQMRSSALQVPVPSLGESISDGVIASVLKSAGDEVEEDEPLVQIETDKVTIDVRAPTAGTIDAILVKPDETVTVGHIVASILPSVETSTDPGIKHNNSSLPTPDTSTTVVHHHMSYSYEKGMAEQATKDSFIKEKEYKAGFNKDRSHAHQPSIRFPPRRTTDGRQISLLPVLEAEDIMKAHQGVTENDTRKSDAIRSPPKHEFFSKSRSRSAAAPLPPRSPLSEREIDAIMLGIAD